MVHSISHDDNPVLIYQLFDQDEDLPGFKEQEFLVKYVSSVYLMSDRIEMMWSNWERCKKDTMGFWF